MPTSSFGPRLQATTGYLSGRFGVSRRDSQELLATLFAVEISLGAIPAQEQRLSQALEQPVQQAQAFLRQQPTVNQEAMLPIRREVETLLQLGTIAVKQRQTQATCRNLLQRKTALWTFVDREGIEPTNNAAEQALRRGVIWRRRSFGTQSQAGSRFVERVLTAVISLRRQHRHVLDFLTEACQAFASAMAAPSLLPAA